MEKLTQRIMGDLLAASKASQDQDDANFLFAVDEPAVGGPAVAKDGPEYQCRTEGADAYHCECIALIFGVCGSD